MLAASVGDVCSEQVQQECPRRLLPGLDVGTEGLDQSRLGWKGTASPTTERSVGPRWPWPGHWGTLGLSRRFPRGSGRAELVGAA